MTLRDLLKMVTEALDGADVPYIVVGSLASTFHGEPRATQDIDIVIDPEPEQLADLLRSFDEETFVAMKMRTPSTSALIRRLISTTLNARSLRTMKSIFHPLATSMTLNMLRERPVRTGMGHLQRWVDALGLTDHLRMAIGEGHQDP